MEPMSQADKPHITKTVTKSLKRREALRLSLGGAAAMATGAALAAAPDPIFAAIEAHKAAYHRFSQAVDISGSLYHTDPRYEEAEKATTDASGALESAAIHLTNILPTSFAGVIALLSYVDDFNLGKMGHSEYYLWPDELTDETVLDESGRHLSLPFPYWIMRNVHKTLQDLVGRVS
jgi:hypothetical protein